MGEPSIVVKISLSVAGDVSVVIDTLRRLATKTSSSPAAPSNNPDGDPHGHPPVDQPVQPPVDVAAGIAEDPWTAEMARALWALLTPDVQDIYRRVAHRDGHVLAREALLDAMGLTARVLSGRLS